MTRLLMVAFNRVGRGTYWRALGFAEQLVQNHGYDVMLIAVAAKPIRKINERTVNGVTLVETPDLMPTSGYDPYDTLLRINWLRGKRFDLIHAFEARPIVIYPALFAQRQSGAPLLTDWCDWFGTGGSVERRDGTLLKTILRPTETYFETHFRPKTAGTTVINRVLQRMAVDLGIDPADTLLLPNGANVVDFAPREKRPLRQKYNLPLDAPLFAYTGAIFADDAALMAQTFDQICQQLPEARLLIIGYSNIDIPSLVKNPDRVIQTGPVSYPELTEYVALADVGLLTLCNNGANQGRFPMKVHDFMAAGVPVLVTEVGDLGDFVRQWQLGNVAVDEAGALAETAVSLIQDKEKLVFYGRNARHIAETEFAWPHVTRKLHQFYEKILSK